MRKGDKKGEYYFQFLTDKEKIEFKENILNLRTPEPDEYLNQFFLSFEKFILYAFKWHKSIEGHGYWEEISLREIQEPQTSTL